ncbi:hypothetical protein GGX14DRAFT_391555 [Mycena pura]|uniref:Uncharacterized protein n=1 Tax=Mycena pura TaxID=153505 RepID=A0AAD6VM61_9AGAR|nr:hypothetical protein GGX14DRAFT_391555 [Mycena pura]
MSSLDSTGTNVQFQPPAEQPAPHSHALCTPMYRICQDVSVTKQGFDIAVAPSSLPPSQTSDSPIPVLPYTGPPPAKSRPRYSGGVPYPDLSLSGPPPEEHRDQHSACASDSITRSTWNRFEPYPSSSARTAQALHGQDSAASPVTPGRYSHVPMPCYADTLMPERQRCEWPDGRSLGGSQEN